MRKKLLIGSATLLLLLGAACGGSDDGDAAGTSGSETESNGEAGGSEGGAVTLTAENIAFDPNELTASVGDTIEFDNQDDVPHTFTAEEAGVDESVEAGASASISLADVEPGTYDFVCTIHPNMTGTLEVTE